MSGLRLPNKRQNKDKLSVITQHYFAGAFLGISLYPNNMVVFYTIKGGASEEAQARGNFPPFLKALILKTIMNK